MIMNKGSYTWNIHDYIDKKELMGRIEQLELFIIRHELKVPKPRKSKYRGGYNTDDEE